MNLLNRALTRELQEQAKIIAAREEAITWLQNELAIARDELRSVKASKFWRIRDFYFGIRHSLARFGILLAELRYAILRSARHHAARWT